ncbi:hypothetical protein CEXT_721951, partial [Caerostris extrusa]
GMTLDCVEVSLSGVFECGQAHRCSFSSSCSLAGLRVNDIEAVQYSSRSSSIEILCTIAVWGYILGLSNINISC